MTGINGSNGPEFSPNIDPSQLSNIQPIDLRKPIDVSHDHPLSPKNLEGANLPPSVEPKELEEPDSFIKLDQVNEFGIPMPSSDDLKLPDATKLNLLDDINSNLFIALALGATLGTTLFAGLIFAATLNPVGLIAPAMLLMILMNKDDWKTGMEATQYLHNKLKDDDEGKLETKLNDTLKEAFKNFHTGVENKEKSEQVKDALVDITRDLIKNTPNGCHIWLPEASDMTHRETSQLPVGFSYEFAMGRQAASVDQFVQAYFAELEPQWNEGKTEDDFVEGCKDLVNMYHSFDFEAYAEAVKSGDQEKINSLTKEIEEKEKAINSLGEFLPYEHKGLIFPATSPLSGSGQSTFLDQHQLFTQKLRGVSSDLTVDLEKEGESISKNLIKEEGKLESIEEKIDNLEDKKAELEDKKTELQNADADVRDEQKITKLNTKLESLEGKLGTLTTKKTESNKEIEKLEKRRKDINTQKQTAQTQSMFLMRRSGLSTNFRPSSSQIHSFFKNNLSPAIHELASPHLELEEEDTITNENPDEKKQIKLTEVNDHIQNLPANILSQV